MSNFVIPVSTNAFPNTHFINKMFDFVIKAVIVARELFFIY